MNELKSIESKTADNTEHLELLESAQALLDEPAALAFFSLLDPYQGRTREIPLRALAAMRATHADFGQMARLCALIIELAEAAGPMPNQPALTDMLELQYVLRNIERLTDLNVPGGQS